MPILQQIRFKAHVVEWRKNENPFPLQFYTLNFSFSLENRKIMVIGSLKMRSKKCGLNCLGQIDKAIQRN